MYELLLGIAFDPAKGFIVNHSSRDRDETEPRVWHVCRERIP